MDGGMCKVGTVDNSASGEWGGGTGSGVKVRGRQREVVDDRRIQ
jgi:hypothetical protein